MKYSDDDIQAIIAQKIADGERTGLFSVSDLPPEVMWAVLNSVSDRNLALDAARDQRRLAEGLLPETHLERLLRGADAAHNAIERLSSEKHTT